jgi:hypothetical protein
MLSLKLIENVQRHCDQILDGLIARIYRDPELPHLRKLPEADLRDRGRAVLRHLDRWLPDGREVALIEQYEILGRVRQQEGIPLHEVVRGFQLLKQQTVGFVRDWGFGQPAAEVQAEEEAEYLVDRFFDRLVYHLVKGYEKALGDAAQLRRFPHP